MRLLRSGRLIMRKSDLCVDVPLAVLDDDIFDEKCDDILTRLIKGPMNNTSESRDNEDQCDFGVINKLLIDLDNENNNRQIETARTENSECDTSLMIDEGDENLGGSLEDLVSHFEEKLASCLKNFGETTEKIAPVQIRSQDEIMSESQIWLTLTGNFGNILPIDWSKTYARTLQLPALNLKPKVQNMDDSFGFDLPEDESLSEALDLHRMVCNHDDWEPPPQSAEEVIEEIDEIIMQQSMNSSGFNEGSSDCVMDSSIDSATVCSALRSPSTYLSQYGYNVMNGSMTLMTRSYESNIGDSITMCFNIEDRLAIVRQATGNKENLQNTSYKQLVALKIELEALVDVYNEELVGELAKRDEFEYEKETKNSFISQLLAVQAKKRQYQATNKKKNQNTSTNDQQGLLRSMKKSPSIANLPQFLTAVIPYDETRKDLDNKTLQALSKILRAINDNNPDVPTMLTDYILNVLCPSTPNGNPIC